MAATPDNREQMLARLRDLMDAWDENATLGEIAIVGGGHEWAIEERPRRPGGRYSRATRRVGYAEKATADVR